MAGTLRAVTRAMSAARRRVSLLDDPSFVTELHEFDSRLLHGTFGREAVALGAVPEADEGSDTADADRPACFLVPGRHQSTRHADPPFGYVVVMMLVGIMTAAVMFHRELLLLF
jgi:hypothetical protein